MLGPVLHPRTTTGAVHFFASTLTLCKNFPSLEMEYLLPSLSRGDSFKRSTNPLYPSIGEPSLLLAKAQANPSVFCVQGIDSGIVISLDDSACGCGAGFDTAVVVSFFLPSTKASLRASGDCSAEIISILRSHFFVHVLGRSLFRIVNLGAELPLGEADHSVALRAQCPSKVITRRSRASFVAPCPRDLRFT